MDHIYQRTFSVHALRNYFARKIFAVPEMQREFVWNASKACALLDSLYRKMPIGTAMIWQTGSDNSTLLRKTLHILPSYDGHQNEHIWYLIDGQQRLSVLYQVFEGKSIVNASGREVDFGRIYFSLDETAEIRFEYLKRPDPQWHICVKELLAADWQQRFGKMRRRDVEKIRDCRRRLLDYQFPMIFVETDDLDELRETFIRINSRGTPVSAADQAFARATHVRLRNLVHEVYSSLKDGRGRFDALPREIVLQAIALMLNIQDVGGRALQAAAKQEEKTLKNWPAFKSAIEKAVDYLVNELGVVDYKVLPSQNMVATLATFYYHNEGQPPAPWQRREIKKWFWATAVCQRYTGPGYRQNILKDSSFFKRLARNYGVHFSLPREERLPLTDLLRADYSRRSGLNDAVYCLLLSRHPALVRTGGLIPQTDYSSIANRKDKHHIFPRKLLEKNGFARKEINRLCNICFIAAEEDQGFGRKRPIDYLDPYRRRKHFASVMKSHLIPYTSTSALWSENIRSGYRQFLKERRDLLARELNKVAGIQLFRQD